jgi:hypothetical protein
MIARITNRGARIMGIPSGLRASAGGFGYPIPDPFAEVFDGIAIGNTNFSSMDAYLKDHSDGSVTVEWQSGGQAVMEATFVHGSPYVYFKAHAGQLVVRTLRATVERRASSTTRATALASGPRSRAIATTSWSPGKGRRPLATPPATGDRRQQCCE